MFGWVHRTDPAPAGTAPLHRRATVYVTKAFSGTVTPILAGGNRPGGPIRVSPGPEQILIGPAGKTAFVAGHRDLPDRGTPATLTAIRTATNVAGKTLRMCRAASGDNLAMAITPDGSTIYFLCPSANRVIPVRTRTMTAGKPINAGPYPDAIAITPDGRTAYVANGGIRTVTPIRTRTNTPGSPIKVGLGPQALAITPDGTMAYVTNLGSGTVTPIRVATGTAGKPIRVGRFRSESPSTPDRTRTACSHRSMPQAVTAPSSCGRSRCLSKPM
jgi:DNA-binding beta-propeller fold protein YncE